MKKFVQAVFALLLCAVSAQAQLPPAAQEALRQGKTAAAQALNTYQTPNPDQPLWAAALAAGAEAERLAPDAPEPQRFLAQVYTSLDWFKRAYDAWARYEQVGGNLDADARSKYAQMSAALGYSRYAQADLTAALAYYQKADELADDDQTLTWLALIAFELGRPQTALPYWQQVTQRQPDNPLYAVYLQRTQDQLEHGVEASNAFYEGLSAYNRGESANALDAFAQATRANPDYADAFERAGTLSLTLARPEDAVTYLQRALSLAPDDAQIQGQLRLAQAQVRWGVQAVAHYQNGLRLLEQNQLGAAEEAFTEATLANGRFADAWAQLGRVTRDLGNLETALQAFARAADLEPGEASYQQQANALRAQLAQSQLAQSQTTQNQTTVQTEAAAAAEPTETSARTPITSSTPATAETNTEAPTATVPDAPETLSATPDGPQVDSDSPNVTSQTSTEASTPVQSPGAAAPNSAPLTLLGVTFTHYGDENRQEAAFSFFETQRTLAFDFHSPRDYAEGTLYQRLEVFSKPSDAVVQYQVCLVPDDITVAPACSDSAALTFDGRGTFEAQQPLTSLLNYRKVDWSKGVASILLVLRDDRGNPVSSNYLLESNPPLSFSDFYPMSVSYSAVIVPPGGVFSGWPEQLTDR